MRSKLQLLKNAPVWGFFIFQKENLATTPCKIMNGFQNFTGGARYPRPPTC